jgi:hypothetical protein
MSVPYVSPHVMFANGSERLSPACCCRVLVLCSLGSVSNGYNLAIYLHSTEAYVWPRLLAFSAHMGQRCAHCVVRMNDILCFCVRALSSERSAFRIQPSTWPQVCRTRTVRQLHYTSLSRGSRGARKHSLGVAASVSFRHSLARGIRSVFHTLTSVTT